jgi:NAD+ synthase (glutamine-hydrolysing)
MNNSFRIAIAQINATVGDLSGNLRKIIEYVKTAKGLEADIVVFPELAICGYPPEDLLLKKHFVKDNLKALDSIIENTSDITAIVGFADRRSVKNFTLYNAAAVIHNGGLKGVYHKRALPNYGVFDEKRYFTPGNENFIFTLGRLKFGITICEDIWENKGPYKVQAELGAKLLINISASPYYAGKRETRKKMLAERAKSTKTFICYANLLGGQDELVFDGGSFIFNPQGELIASGEQFEEDMVVADLDMHPFSRSTFSRKGLRHKPCRCIRLSYKEDNVEKPALSRRIFKALDGIEEIYEALVLGARDYVRKNGFEKVIIGLSGGIDSSLTALIACDALGKENVIGVSMPSRYSSQETQADAMLLARNLGITFMFIPINAIFNVYLITLEKTFFGLNRDITEENIQARIRGNILMALSNKFGWLVLTTGNKSETSVGYCTLYGDMAGGFAAIKDVTKTLVYELADFRNKMNSQKVIPESVFKREPTAELKFDQRDQDMLPPYSVLDEILIDYIEKDKGFEEIASKRKDPKIVEKVIGMVDRNEYKRRQSPPGIKITPKAFGKDRRLPITNKYRGIEYYE